jgi:pilus assembly protein CpaC
MSGQPAEFLAGGQVPYTTSDGNGGTTTVFKDYGVQLAFTPTVRSDGQIQLLVDTTVSEPLSSGALTERHAKTTVEMPTGTTLAIGGMLQDTQKQEFNSFPGLGSIPILGALFRSRDFLHDKTELVILVTPYLAQPTSGPVPTPTDNFHMSGDAEAIFLGHMQKLYGVSDQHAAPSQYQGSVGFSLE